jgi:hypothetical protein
MTYPGRWIVLQELMAWPLCSLDLILMDFFLWGHLKEHVYGVPLRTIIDLMAKLQAAETTFDASMLRHL